MSDPILQLVCAALVLLVPVGVQQGLRPSSVPRILALAAVGLAAAVASLVADAVTGVASDLAASALDACFAGAVATTVALVVAQRLGTAGGVFFGLSWSIVVYQPIAAAVLDGVPSLVQVAFGAIDYGAVLASHVAAAAALLALSLLPVARRRDGAHAAQTAVRVTERVTWGRGVVGASLIVVGGSAWLLGVERVLSVSSGRTLANALAGMVLGALIWIVVEKIAVDRASPDGLIAGSLLGWAAIGAGAPYLSPLALIAAVVVGTAAAVGAVAKARARGAGVLRWGSTSILVAVAVGSVVMTLLADRFGLAEMATITFTVEQLTATAVIAVVAGAGGIVCGLLAWGVSRWAIPDSN
jgi:ammonia channel protein AmtB